MTSFVHAINNLSRTVKLYVMIHMTSLNMVLTSIFAFDRSLQTFFHYMSIHLNQWQSLTALKDTLVYSIQTELRKMVLYFASHDQSTAFIVRTKDHLIVTFIYMLSHVTLLTNNITMWIYTFYTQLIDKSLNRNIPLDLILFNIRLAKRTNILLLDTVHTEQIIAAWSFYCII